MGNWQGAQREILDDLVNARCGCRTVAIVDALGSDSESLFDLVLIPLKGRHDCVYGNGRKCRKKDIRILALKLKRGSVTVQLRHTEVSSTYLALLPCAVVVGQDIQLGNHMAVSLRVEESYST